MEKILKQLGWTLFPRFLAKKYLYKDNWAELEQIVVPIFLSKTTESIDVGANHGRYTTLMSLFSRQVYAFEPSPKCLVSLQNLCLPNVSIYPYALSNQQGVSEYFVPLQEGIALNTRGTLNRSALSAHPDIDTLRVTTSTMDSLCDRPISFIKIDVEGHEMDVLKGGRKLILEQKPVVMVEAEERHCAGALQQVKTFFDELDYQGFYILEQEVFPLESFKDELQNPQELERPIPRDQMRYVNNFIFLPSSPEIEQILEKIRTRLQDESLTWRLM